MSWQHLNQPCGWIGVILLLSLSLSVLYCVDRISAKPGAPFSLPSPLPRSFSFSQSRREEEHDGEEETEDRLSCSVFSFSSQPRGEEEHDGEEETECWFSCSFSFYLLLSRPARSPAAVAPPATAATPGRHLRAPRPFPPPRAATVWGRLGAGDTAPALARLEN